MRNGKLRGLLITVMLLVFLAGLASILYPYIWGAAVAGENGMGIFTTHRQRASQKMPHATVQYLRIRAVVDG